MTARKRSTPPPPAPSAGVEQLITTLAHPQEQEIRALRALILGVRKGIREEVKWNAPSFATTEHFATFHLRAKEGIQLVLHLGAKPRGDTGLRQAIKDPQRLLDWKGADRATVTFRDMSDVEANGGALVAILKQWLRFV